MIISAPDIPRASSWFNAFSIANTSGKLPGCLVNAIGCLFSIEYRARYLTLFNPSPALLKPYLASSWFSEYVEKVVES